MEDIPTPEIGPDDLQLKMSRCGICGSDINVANEQQIPESTVFGHEFSGVIEQVGSNAAADWQMGDRVISLGGIPCGDCPSCDIGHDAKCQQIGLIGY
jgi:threonine dehydrogenase-like Zn-dependent dehydrogenase